MWEEMDIISALGIKTGHSLVVSKIFSFLEPIDLINVTLVSEQWKQLCYFDRASSRRLRKFTAKRKRQKENCNALGKKPRKEIEYKVRIIIFGIFYSLCPRGLDKNKGYASHVFFFCIFTGKYANSNQSK